MSEVASDPRERPQASPLRVGAALGGIVLAAVVVFALGVMVGTRVVESGPAFAPPPAALPTENVPPVPAAPAGIPPEKLTFYDRLSGVAPPPPLPLPEDQPPAEAAPRAAQEPAAPVASAAPAAPPVPAAPKAALEIPAREAQAKTPAPPAKSDPEAQIRKLAGKGSYAVQVVAVTERAAADAAAARIRSQGFEAVTVMASVKGKVWYRIRVGSFPSKKAAGQAAGIFRSAYGYDAIVVHD